MNAVPMIIQCMDRQWSHLDWIMKNRCECGELILNSRWQCATCALKAQIAYVSRVWPSRG